MACSGTCEFSDVRMVCSTLYVGQTVPYSQILLSIGCPIAKFAYSAI
jgi:hypothetical protein